MDIKNYQSLITNLPVRQQCFSTKRTTWRSAEKEIGWLESVNYKLFDNAEILRISRQDVFYSKLFYFAELSFDGNPCLILDERLFNVFRDKTYSQFDRLSGINRAAAEKGRYLDYLKVMKEVSLEIGATGEQLELFLFTFGNQLKQAEMLTKELVS